MRTTQKGAAGGERLAYTVAEAAEALGVNRQFLYRQLRAGAVPSVRLGQRILVPRLELERVLAGQPSEKHTDAGASVAR